jgi:spermidine synthase
MHKNLLFFIIASTGAISLVYQVIWQRYLALLLGSDARSGAIVVAIFLLGLSCGYAFFGKLALRFKTRKQFLTFYGAIEFATGAYAIIFPTWFAFFNDVVPSLSSNIFGQLLVSLLLLFIPTFMMGATIPVMTTVIPEKSSDIHRDHAVIYGVNTLGAFLGVWIAILYIIPEFGLSFGLTVMGVINILASLPYIGNNLVGTIEKKEAVVFEQAQESISVNILYLVAFTSGLVGLTLELLWFRITSLTIGSSILVFPMVLGIFVAGLGLGSLTLGKNNKKPSLVNTLTIALFLLVISYHVVPFLPYWISHIRVLMVSHPFNFPIFYFLCFLVFSLFLIPPLFYLGRVLPVVYALIPKDGKNYGERCSKIYLLNTIGTFVGSLALGYYLLYLLDINYIYVMCIIFFFAIIVFLSRYRLVGHRNGLIILAILTLIYPWNRSYHQYGSFRKNKIDQEHFQGLFELPKYQDNMYFKDGPNTTVALMKSNEMGYSVMVNGKSDGSTKGDYSTFALTGLIPVAYHSSSEINAMLVGIGTGVTLDVLSRIEKVKKIDVAEISPFVVKAASMIDQSNLSSKKINVYIRDAFNYLKHTNEEYNLIISQPSNVWVVGVENLFTEYYYNIANSKLANNGIFVQWMQTYSISTSTITTVLSNLKKVFPYVRVFTPQHGDLLFIASKSELSRLPVEIINNGVKLKDFEAMKLKGVNDFIALEYFTNRDVDLIIKSQKAYFHDVDFPVMSQNALKSMFLDESIDLKSILDPIGARSKLNENVDDLFNWYEDNYLNIIESNKTCDKDQIQYPYCTLSEAAIAFKYWKQEDLALKLKSYAVLRKLGILNKIDLDVFYSEIDKKEISNDLKLTYLREYLKDGEFEKAIKMASRLKLNQKLKQIFEFELNQAQDRYRQL